jgi:phosphatidylserine synthase
VFGWKPGIGDPTVYGWVVAAAYALGAILCWRASRRGPTGERRFWRFATALLAFLAINKQLDLQTLFTDVARAMAKLQGWYANRRDYQEGFIAGLAAAFAAIVLILMLRSRRDRPVVRGTVVGIALILLFVLVRASSIDRIDSMLARHLGGIKINHTLELGSIAIVVACAFLAGRPSGRRR